MLRIVTVLFIALLASVIFPEHSFVWASDTQTDASQSDAANQTKSGESDIDTENAIAEEEASEEFEIPEISYDLTALPFPTRRMHELILEATRAGDIEKLRAYIGSGDNMTLLSLGGVEGDPIEFLKQQSGDVEGHELLAILEEILEAGYVRLDPDTDRELFVWPYFFAMPIDRLTERQRVELFRIVTYGDFQDMEDFGGYIFYRVGITPTGRWQFFVAGD
ncbi:MAG: hypothetical protein AAF478_02885 [Pseudomonadota bacterium]